MKKLNIGRKIVSSLLMFVLITSMIYSASAIDINDPFVHKSHVNVQIYGWEGNYTQYYFGKDWIERNLKKDGAYISGVCVDTKKALATSIFLSMSAIKNNNPDDLKLADKILMFIINQKNKIGLYYYYKDNGNSYVGIEPSDEGLLKLYIFALSWDVLAHNYLEKLGLENKQYIVSFKKVNNYPLLFNITTPVTVPSNVTQYQVNEYLNTALPTNINSLNIQNVISYAQNLLNNHISPENENQNISNNQTKRLNITIYYYTNNDIIEEYYKELEENKEKEFISSILYKIGNITEKPISETQIGEFVSLFGWNVDGNIYYYSDDITKLFTNPQYIALSPYYNMGYFNNEDEITNLIYIIEKLDRYRKEHERLVQITPKTGNVVELYKLYTYYSNRLNLTDYLKNLNVKDVNDLNNLLNMNKYDLGVLLATSSFCKDLQLTLQDEENKIKEINGTIFPMGKDNIQPLPWRFDYTQILLDNAYILNLPPEIFVIAQKPKSPLYKDYEIWAYDYTPVFKNGDKLYTFETLIVSTSKAESPEYTVYIYGLKNGTVYIKYAGGVEIHKFTTTLLQPATICLDIPPKDIEEITIIGYDWGNREICKDASIGVDDNGKYVIKPILLSDVNKTNVGSVFSYLITYYPNAIYDINEPKLNVILSNIHSNVTTTEIERFLTKNLLEEYLNIHKKIISTILMEKYKIINGTIQIPRNLDEKEDGLYETIHHLEMLGKWKLQPVDEYHNAYISFKTNPNLNTFEKYVETLYSSNILEKFWKTFWSIRDNIILKKKIDYVIDTGNVTVIKIPKYADDKELITIAEYINKYATAKTKRDKAYIGKDLLKLIPTNSTLAKVIQNTTESYLVDLSCEEKHLVAQFIHNNKKWNQTVDKTGIERILFIEREFENLNDSYANPELLNDFEMIYNAPNDTKLIAIATKVKSYELRDWSRDIINQYNKYVEYLKELERQRELELQKAKERQKMTILIMILAILTALGIAGAFYLKRRAGLTYEVVNFNRDNGVLTIKVLKPTNILRVRCPKGWVAVDDKMVGDDIIREGEYSAGDIVKFELRKVKDDEANKTDVFKSQDVKESNVENKKEGDEDDFELPFEN